jgi:hypothetical protein
MMSTSEFSITVGKPNWTPLERVLSPDECTNYMYMGRAGEIELYKHRHTRRYLNIRSNGSNFYLYSGGNYVEVTQAEALDHVHS